MTVAQSTDSTLDTLVAAEIAAPDSYETIPVASKRSALEWPQWVARRHMPGVAACAVAYRLASYWNAETGDAWPSYPLLAADLCCSEGTVATAVGRLETFGVLLIDRHPRKSNRYTLLRAVPILTLQETTPRVSGDDTLPSRRQHPGCQSMGGEAVGIPQSSKKELARSAGTAPPPAAERRCSVHLLPVGQDGACRGCRADVLAGDL